MQKRLVRLCGLAAAVSLVAITLIWIAAPSNAVPTPPYGSGTTDASVSETNPNPGDAITVEMTGCNPGDTVTVVLHSDPVTLGTMTANASGVATGTFTIPAGFSGAHTIVVTDNQTGISRSIAITIGGAASSSGALPSTGTAVIAFGVLAAILLGSGGLILLLGRRRNKNLV